MRKLKTFKDLEFKEYPDKEWRDGVQALMFFPNGYGISVIRFKLTSIKGIDVNTYGTYTDNDNEWEVAILKGEEDTWGLCSDSKLGESVRGHHNFGEVCDLMEEIQKL